MFKIGEFSRLCQVPVSALRYYAEIGLLLPARVDGQTSYRYYSAEQLSQIYRILALRDLGLSLDQIGLLLRDDLPAEQIRGMLRLRQAELRQHLEEEQVRLIRVEERLRQLEQENGMSSYDVAIKELSAQLVAGVRDTIPTYPDVGRLFDELYAYLGRQGTGGLGAAIYHDESYKEGAIDAEAVAFLSFPVPESERVRVYDLPPITVASTIHSGAFNRFREAYDALGRWIEANGYRIAGAPREVYLHTNQPMRQDDESNVTEIQFPITKDAK
jgi:DNA-binding transcriptional MerR regulator